MVASTLSRLFKKDDLTDSMVQIGYEHHEIHDGSHFNYCDYALAQAASATVTFLMATPDTTTAVHLSFQVSSSDGATIELYEGATGSSGGTAITPRNNNRGSTNTSIVILTKDPTTITSYGVRAAGYIAGGDRSSGFVGRDKEIILARNQKYVVKITSLAVSNDIGWCSDWYEH